MNAKKPRTRHVASDEAHAWARSLALNNPNAKTVLRALALYVNGEGSCFVGIDQLSDDTDLSADTVRRRLVWLEQIGAIVRLHQWLDENGRRNGEGRGKRTSDEIRLLLASEVDEIERRARGEIDEENVPNTSTETTAFSPSREQGLESVSPALAPRQPSQSCDHLTSEPEPEESPQPPCGGSVAEIEGWKDFEKDWQEPILRQSLAQQVWSALKPEEQNLARSAARGYVAYRKAQRKPPNVLGAHLFLKETAAWAEFAKRDPLARSGGVTGILADSPEGRAISTLYAVARAHPFEHKGRITYPGEISPQILAFSAAPDVSEWVAIDEYPQLLRWTEFLNAKVFGARPALAPGFRAPWPWPPPKDGRSSTELTDQDAADFK